MAVGQAFQEGGSWSKGPEVAERLAHRRGASEGDDGKRQGWDRSRCVL